MFIVLLIYEFIVSDGFNRIMCYPLATWNVLFLDYLSIKISLLVKWKLHLKWNKSFFPLPFNHENDVSFSSIYLWDFFMCFQQNKCIVSYTFVWNAKLMDTQIGTHRSCLSILLQMLSKACLSRCWCTPLTICEKLV